MLLREISPAGEPVIRRNGALINRSQGWMVMMHVNKWWRSCALGMRVLWRQDVCAFPSTPAITEIARRAGGLALIIDIDRLLDSCGSVNKDAVFKWLLTHNDGRVLLSSAEIVKCTFSLGHRNSTTVNYAPLSLNDRSWRTAFDELHCPLLRSLIMPHTQTFLRYIPRIDATYLKTLHLLGICVTQSPATTEGGYSRIGYSASRSWTHEPEGKLTALVNALQSLPSLEELYLDGVHYGRSVQRVQDSIVCNSLQRIRIYCAEPDCITKIYSKVVAPYASWTIVTRIEPPVDIYDCLWDVAGLGSGQLKLYVEGNHMVKWLTFSSIDSAQGPDPIFGDGSDNLDIATHRARSPNVYARPGRLSVAYPANVSTHLRAIIKGRVRRVVIRGVTSRVDGVTIWERAHDNWSFMSDLDRYTLDIQDERIMHDDIGRTAACPTDIIYTCQTQWSGPGGFDGLEVALATWSLREKHPSSITVRGSKRWWDDRPIREISDRMAGAVSDERTADGPYSVRPWDPLKGELQLARRELAYAEVRSFTPDTST